MAASYPTSAKAFTTKNNGPGNTIDASHVNDLQAEVTAVEQDLIAGLPAVRGGTGNTTAGTLGQVLTSTGTAYTPQDPVAARFACQGRLSLTTGVPITSGDVTAATTLYWALYQGNQIGLYTGTAWVAPTVAELSIPVPATTNQMYDVFVDYNAGTPQLSLTAWTNDTTRATALILQDGILVLSGSLEKRYVGSFRTTGVSGQTEDSALKHYVWNYYHRAPRKLRVTDATNSWVYSTATIRQANAAAANQVEVVVGVAEVRVDLLAISATSSAASVGVKATGIGQNSTTAFAADQIGGASGATTVILQQSARLVTMPAIGFSFFAWLESGSAGTDTWYGDNGDAALMQSGLSGVIDG